MEHQIPDGMLSLLKNWFLGGCRVLAQVNVVTLDNKSPFPG
jgi:hypothetical protein